MAENFVIYSSSAPGGVASLFQPAKPSRLQPNEDAADKAVARYNDNAAKIAAPLRQFQTPSAYQNLDIILARLNRIEQMIDGATIEAECDPDTSTITVTLTWGS